MIITRKFDYKDYKRVSGKHGRYYSTGDGNILPSVTTILDKVSDKSAIDSWRDRVGKETAERITKESSDIGSILHDNLENYVLSGKRPEGPPLAKMMTNSIIKGGLSKVDEVWGTEVKLYYPGLYAGTTDLVGVFKESPAIIDYKNSRKYKNKEWITNYFMQLVAYAEAHNALYGTAINTGVIMMSTFQGKYLEFSITGVEYDKYKEMWFSSVYEFYDRFELK